MGLNEGGSPGGLPGQEQEFLALRHLLNKSAASFGCIDNSGLVALFGIRSGPGAFLALRLLATARISGNVSGQSREMSPLDQICCGNDLWNRTWTIFSSGVGRSLDDGMDARMDALNYHPVGLGDILTNLKKLSKIHLFFDSIFSNFAKDNIRSNYYSLNVH